MNDVATIAAGLTKVQAEALMNLEAWSGHTRAALQRAGLAGDSGGSYRKLYYEAYRYPFSLTELGRAVRGYLLQQEAGQ